MRRQLDAYLIPAERRHALGVIVPHAGWIYSGKVCGEVLRHVEVTDTVVILCPNHTGLTRTGAPASLLAEGAYDLPGGPVPVDVELAGSWMRHASQIQSDPAAHSREHAIEVVLPFLRHENPNVKIVPVVMKSGTLEDYKELAQGLAETIRDSGREVLIVASSDMTHYESVESARWKDQRALDHVLQLDGPGLLETARRHNITMCGVIGAAVMLMAARELGATRAELAAYAHSGEVSGDYERVVAYAGVWVV